MSDVDMMHEFSVINLQINLGSAQMQNTCIKRRIANKRKSHFPLNCGLLLYFENLKKNYGKARWEKYKRCATKVAHLRSLKLSETFFGTKTLCINCKIKLTHIVKKCLLGYFHEYVNRNNYSLLRKIFIAIFSKKLQQKFSTKKLWFLFLPIFVNLSIFHCNRFYNLFFFT